MISRKFITWFNWRVVFTHLLASFFIILAVRHLTLLYDLPLVIALQNASITKDYNSLTMNFAPQRMEGLRSLYDIAPFAGLLVAFLLSLIVAILKKQFWVHSLIIFLIGYLLVIFHVFDQRAVNMLFYSAGRLLTRCSPTWPILLNSTLLFSIGVYLFFSKPLAKFMAGLSIHNKEESSFDDVLIK